MLTFLSGLTHLDFCASDKLCWLDYSQMVGFVSGPRGYVLGNSAALALSREETSISARENTAFIEIVWQWAWAREQLAPQRASFSWLPAGRQSTHMALAGGARRDSTPGQLTTTRDLFTCLVRRHRELTVRREGFVLSVGPNKSTSGVPPWWLDVLFS